MNAFFKRHRRRIVYMVLIASLGANLFLGSMMAGQHFAGQRKNTGFRSLTEFSHSLNASERAELKAMLEHYRPRMVQTHKAMAQQRDHLKELLKKEPFDRTEAESILADMRLKNQELQSLYHAFLLEAASKLPPERRSQLVNLTRGRP